MVQFLFTLWFAFTTLLGPGLCCCTLLSNVAAYSVSQQSPTPEPARQTKKCCHCEGKANLPVPSDKSSDGPHPPGQPCPCKQKSPSCTAQPKTTAVTQPEYQGFHWLTAVFSPVGVVALPALFHQTTIKVFPLASAPDIHTLCQLRC
jgi:hypothetical protein